MNEGSDHGAPLRIIDANLNRAREALRVMEEYARFGLDDAALAQAVKTLRHRLAQGVPVQISEALIRRRDIVGDVGRETKTDGESIRTDERAVVTAAAKRLSEALRAIEEYGKTIDGEFAAAIERIRYEGYEVERRLALTMEAVRRFGHVRLYVLLTEEFCARDWLETASGALEGGADCLQLRERHLPDGALLDRARRLSTLCHSLGRLFIVNDRADIAAASGADGVHLGRDDLPIAAARRILPGRAIVGVSTHTIEQIERAAENAPDYIAVGPMFATQTKPQNYIAGPRTLAQARRHTSLPLVAIGGIDETNAPAVLEAGPCALCVCRAAIAQQDVAAACRRLRNMTTAVDPAAGLADDS